jgi:hypothetical protein
MLQDFSEWFKELYQLEIRAMEMTTATMITTVLEFLIVPDQLYQGFRLNATMLAQLLGIRAADLIL